MAKFTITKVKLVKRETLEWQLEKAEGGKRSEDSKEIVHEDLKTAIDALRIHWAILCGYVQPAQVKDIETPPEDLVNDIHIHGFSFGGDDGAEWIIITGHKILSTKKAVNVNTPMTRFEEDEKTAYVFIDDLEEKRARIDKEVRAYIDKSKLGKSAQQTLDFNQPVTKLVIAEPEKKVFKGTKESPAAVLADIIADTNERQETRQKETAAMEKAKNGKRVKQTADNPGGIKHD